MALAAGDKLGPYEILGLIGAGGMGEVYRAKDIKLKRDVALKVLPAAYSTDPERIGRFQREAEVLASLDYPNIAPIYGMVESDGVLALTLALIEGPTLADRIAVGPLPLEEAVSVARQIIAALEYAHDRGVIHRDLKPANVKVTPEGAVKVLDFGLAKVLDDEQPAASGANSPTLTLGHTRAGVILGTAAYMSPEQAVGKTADRRSDIFSFGSVLFELLTGQRAFGGDSAGETLVAVAKDEPDWSKLPAGTPRAMEKLLRRCLVKDRRQRLQAIGEARILLESPEEPPQVEVSPVAVPPRRLVIWMASTAVMFLALAALASIHFRETTPPEHPLRYTIAPPEGTQGIHSFAVSPDGRMVVIAAAVNGKRQLWLRPLDALQAQPMPFTEDAMYPFWSPDSRYIGFFAQGKLRKIAASGGPSQSLCDAADGRGGTWSSDDVIVFSPVNTDTAIQRVLAAGGVPADVTKTKGIYRFPKFLPDGRHFLYLVSRMSAEKNGVYLSSLDGSENRRVLADESSVVFAPSATGSRSGHLLFIRDNTLMAQPFDGGNAQLSGEVFPVTEGVSFTNVNNFAPVTASEDGVLLYWTGAAGGIGGGNNQIVWYDRGGKLIEQVGTPGNVLAPAISPDEKTIAFSKAAAGGNRDIVLRDLVRQNDRRLTTDASNNFGPFFSPKNGDRIVFRSTRSGHPGDLYLRASNGSGLDEVLVSTPNSKVVNQWSRDGRFIVYMEADPKTKNDLWYLPVGEDGKPSGKPVQFLHSEFGEMQGQLSPDSRWMAYTSDVSGPREVYVQPFPAADNELRISTAGGEQPRWKRDGKELFYLAADGKLTVVTVTVSAGPKPSLKASAPVALFDTHQVITSAAYFNYDVTGDGKRFLVVTTAGTASSSGPSTPPLTVRINWNAASKK